MNSFFFKGEKYVEDYLLDCTSDIPWSRGKRAWNIFTGIYHGEIERFHLLSLRDQIFLI